MIDTRICNFLSRHEAMLESILQQTDIPAVCIKDAITYALFPGGKRLRPCLVYLSGELAHVSLECLDVIAAAIELTHCYSLVHDDLPAMDNDDFRRGKPSCHRAFDEATAILVGDALQAMAIELLLSKLPHFLLPEQVIDVTRILVHASGPSGMVSGQSLDLSELSNPDINESQLRLIHSLKTGKLISACIAMVLAACTPTPELHMALSDFARHLGLVFQMQDDYLDVFAPAHILGKGRSSDRANLKATFATIYTQGQLEDLIHRHYALAKDALAPLGEHARDLLALSQSMQQRGQTREPS